MTGSRLVDSLQRSVGRVRNRLRSLRLVRWLAKEEGVLWASIIEPTPTAIHGGLPRLGDYRGLRAILDLRNSDGHIEWHFLWGTECAADRQEPRIAASLTATPLKRITVRAVEVPKEAWWRRTLPWGLATGLLASLAALTANLESVNGFAQQLFHEPHMTLEAPERIRIASDMIESQQIKLLGDPFSRVRLADLRMQINPDPNAPSPAQPLKQKDFVVPLSDRSVDVSEQVTIPIRFQKLPPGRYLATLRGRIHTVWRSAEFAPSEPLRLDVRPPVSIAIQSVIPWPADTAGGLYPECLIDLRLEFGRPGTDTSSLWILLDGKWIGWSVHENVRPRGATIERISQNSLSKAKPVVFILNNVSSASFSTQYVRVQVKAEHPMSESEWHAKVQAAEVESN